MAASLRHLPAPMSGRYWRRPRCANGIGARLPRHGRNPRRTSEALARIRPYRAFRQHRNPPDAVFRTAKRLRKKAPSESMNSGGASLSLAFFGLLLGIAL